MNVPHKIYVFRYFNQMIICLQYKHNIKMTIFAKSVRDAGLRFQTLGIILQYSELILQDVVLVLETKWDPPATWKNDPGPIFPAWDSFFQPVTCEIAHPELELVTVSTRSWS